jgi:DNA anti-recombination protein RmuC
MLRAAVEKKLKDLLEDNTKQLDLMRVTVDEKLQSTLWSGLCDYVQREYKVVIAGPTTLWAILKSLQIGLWSGMWPSLPFILSFTRHSFVIAFR